MTIRAIQATFSDWRTVKGRKVLQIVFEVPLEQQNEVLSMLGAPMPDEQKWCAIALLAQPPTVPPVEQYISTNVFDGTRPVPKEHADRLREKAQARYHSQTEMEKAVTRAAMLCQDRGFAVWLTGDPLTPVQVASVLREACGVTSRSDIGTDIDAYDKFIKIETEYKLHSGQMAEPR